MTSVPFAGQPAVVRRGVLTDILAGLIAVLLPFGLIQLVQRTELSAAGAAPTAPKPTTPKPAAEPVAGPGTYPALNPALVTPAPTAVSPAPVQVAMSPAPTSATATYRVQPGDTLWRIAHDRLGDFLAWQEIWALNRGRAQPDGRAMTDPSVIYPGWQLLLPVKPPTNPALSTGPIATPTPSPAPTAPTPAPGYAAKSSAESTTGSYRHPSAPGAIGRAWQASQPSHRSPGLLGQPVRHRSGPAMSRTPWAQRSQQHRSSLDIRSGKQPRQAQRGDDVNRR